MPLFADVTIVVLWGMFLLAAVVGSSYLYEHFGVLVASQAMVATAAALIDVVLTARGYSSLLSMIIALASAALLSVLQVPVLLRTGPYLLLILTIVAHIFSAELWLAVPGVTGGSGGLLRTTEGHVFQALTVLTVILAGALSYGMGYFRSRRMRFHSESARELGARAAVFGVPTVRHYVLGFLMFGFLVGASGVAATRVAGYVTVGFLGLTWSLAALMIVLATSRQSWLVMAVLTLLYSAVRVTLRQSVNASPTASTAFEIAFPLLLLWWFHVKGRRTFANGGRQTVSAR